jgi:hypothetical protein
MWQKNREETVCEQSRANLAHIAGCYINLLRERFYIVIELLQLDGAALTAAIPATEFV